MTTPFVLPTLQELFNIGWQHFVVDNAPLSYDSTTGRCSYRGPNGAKCLIGLVIPDEVYRDDFDTSNLPVNKLIYDGYLAPAPGETTENYLKAQQELHDTFKFFDTPETREASYRKFAKVHNLEIPK